MILIADRRYSLVAETKDDTIQTVAEAMELITYSTSVPTVLSYAAIFDSLWQQTVIYEQLKKAHELHLISDKTQKEFISNAAHELRTQIQPIHGISEILRNSVQNTKDNGLVEVTPRNAQRLKKLSEDILEVSKMESDAMSLNKEQFKVHDEMVDTIKHYKNNVNNKNIQFEYATHDDDLTVLADRSSICRVISNLISNSIKFIPRGDWSVVITINADRNKIADSNGDGKEKVAVIVKDTGIGKDEKIFLKLYTKFSTKSLHGMGLGLYISKQTVEAHGGRMWAKNNENVKGSTFSFSLPLRMG